MRGTVPDTTPTEISGVGGGFLNLPVDQDPGDHGTPVTFYGYTPPGGSQEQQAFGYRALLKPNTTTWIITSPSPDDGW